MFKKYECKLHSVVGNYPFRYDEFTTPTEIGKRITYSKYNIIHMCGFGFHRSHKIFKGKIIGTTRLSFKKIDFPYERQTYYRVKCRHKFNDTFITEEHCVLPRDIIKIEDQPVAKIGREPRPKSPPLIKMNITSIHAKHKKVLNKWKNYRAEVCDKLSDVENAQLDNFIVDLAGVLSDLNKYIESIMCPEDEAKALEILHEIHNSEN